MPTESILPRAADKGRRESLESSICLPSQLAHAPHSLLYRTNSLPAAPGPLRAQVLGVKRTRKHSLRVPAVGSRQLFLHHLSANFTAFVGISMDIEIPPTALQFQSLRIRKGRLPFDWTCEIAADRHHRRSVLAHFGRPMEMSGGGRPAQTRIGYRPGQLLRRRVVGCRI
jgi:hypothetical protein